MSTKAERNRGLKSLLSSLCSEDQEFQDGLRRLLNKEPADPTAKFPVTLKGERLIAKLTFRTASNPPEAEERGPELYEVMPPPAPIETAREKSRGAWIIPVVASTAAVVIVANAFFVSWYSAGSVKPLPQQANADASGELRETDARNAGTRTGNKPGGNAEDQSTPDVSLIAESRAEIVKAVASEVKAAFHEEFSKHIVAKAGTEAKIASSPAVLPSVALSDEGLNALAEAVAKRVKFPTAEEIAVKMKGPEPKKEEQRPSDTKAAAAAKPPTSKEIAEQVKSVLSSDIQVLKDRTALQASAKSGNEGDIWIVGLHTKLVDQSLFKPALGDVLRSYPRGAMASVRVGYMYAETAQLNAVVRLDAAQVDLGVLGNASQDASEFPQGFGVELDRLFDRKRPKQCAVLIASASCQVLRPDEPGWEVIPEVHVVLVARQEIDDEQKARLIDWHRFVQARKGTLRVVFPEVSIARQNEILKRELRQICDTALQGQ